MGRETYTGDVAFEQRGHCGIITLNRPEALNALTQLMCESITIQLQDWAEDPHVLQVLIRGAGERGLCAGGDIASVYRDMVALQEQDGGGLLPDRRPAYQATFPAEEFFASEYAMNLLIAEYPKPVVALMDGVVLGGGVGISAHASHRVVTERSRIGMPETGIGFAPDVGASFLLARARQHLGLHIGLTGQLLSAADAIHIGLADHRADSSALEAMVEALTAEPAEQVCAQFALPSGESQLAEDAQWTEPAYDAATVDQIYARLQEFTAEHPRAGEAAETLRGRSPVMLTVAHRAINAAAQLSLEEALVQEHRVAVHAVRSHDFREGVRAQIIDKDRSPQWRPERWEDVAPWLVDQYFTPVPGKELDVRTGRMG